MADRIITLDRLQIKRSKVAGRRPVSLADGEEFVNHTDGFRLIGDGVTPGNGLPAYPLRPGIDDVPGLRAVADAAAAAIKTGHTLIADQDYQCLATDVQVGMKPLTAPRTILLPDVDTFPFQDLVIGDESLSCSEALTITILPGPGTDDVIATSEGNVILSRPGEIVWFRRGAANLWMVRR